MFESIVIRPNETRQFPVDLGLILENLFFYQSTKLHIGNPHIQSLIKVADTDSIVSLFSRPELEVFWAKDHTGILSSYDASGQPIHMLSPFRISNLDIEERLYNLHFEITNEADRSRDFARKLVPHIKIYSLPTDFSTTIDQELLDGEFIQQVAARRLKMIYPTRDIDTHKVIYEIENVDDGFLRLHTNISATDFPDFAADDALLNIGNVVEDVHVMAENNSEISIPELNSEMIRVKFEGLLSKTDQAKSEISHFNHFIYDHGLQLREEVSAGRRSINDFLPLLDKAQRYKEWLQHLDEDANLVKEYVDKVGEKTWLQSVQSKSIRFYLVNTLNTVINATAHSIGGLIATLGLSAFNTFILEKLVSKWKPNQFIEQELIKTLKNS